MSQDGVVLGIDAKFLNDLKKADEGLRKIEATTNRMTQSFIALSNNGLRTFNDVFTTLFSQFGKLSSSDKNLTNILGLNQASREISNVSNQLTTMGTIADRVMVGGKNYSYGGRFNSLNLEIETATRRLEELRSKMSSYTTGTNKSAPIPQSMIDGWAQEANALMQKIQLLQQERQQIINNAQTRIQSSMSQQELDRQWMAMERDKAKREQEAAEAASRNAKQRSEAYARSYEEQYRMYEQMFDKISRKEQEASRKTFSGAMKYSAEAQTIQQQIQAIKYLKQARASLDKSQLGQKAYEQQVRAINKEIQRQQSEVDRLTNKYRGASNSAQGFGNILRAVFGIEAMRRFASQLVQIRGEFELQQRSLQALLQNRQEADELWDRTVQLAIRSPFQIKQLVTYTKQLAAYRVESDKLYDTTKMLADISAGLGVDMQRLILAYGQVKAANYLRGTELRQFSEAGINVLGELATYFSELEGRAVTVGQVFERVSKRMVAFADVDEVLKRVTGEGGIFYNMQEKQAETLKGQISNLKDSLHIMFNDIGQSNDGMLKGMVSMIRYVLENWQIFMAVLKGAAVVMASLGVATLATSWKMGAFSASTIAATASTTGLTAAVARLGIALKSMFRVMAAHPIALVVALIAAAGVAIYDMTRASKRAREEYEKSVGEIVANRIEVSAYSEKLIKLTNAQNELNESMKDSSKTSDEYAKKQEELSNIEKEREKTIKALSAIDSSYAQMMMSKKNDVEQLTIAARAYNDELRARLELENKLVDTPEDVSEWQDLYTSEQRALSQLLGTRGEYTKRVEDLLSGDTSNLYATEKNALNEFLNSADTYENRIVKLYKDLKMFRDGDTRRIGAYFTLGFDWNTPMNRYLHAQHELDKQEKIIKDQLETSAEDFRNTERGKSLVNILSSDSASQEQKDNAKNAIINFFDGILTDKKIEGELRRRVQNTLAESFNIDWRIIEGTNLEQWQKNYNALLEELTEGTRIGGLSSIRSNQTNVVDQRKQVEEFIKAQQEIIDVYTKASDTQGVYTEEQYELALRSKSIAEAMRAFLGGFGDTKDKGDEKSLSNRIRLIRQINEEYEKLRKSWGAEDAEKRVIDAYGKTFKMAFEGTGVSLTKAIFNNKALDELKGGAHESGKIISEEVAATMQSMAESGAHIRTFDDELVEFIKRHEGYRADVYKDVVGIATQGYGETVDIEPGVSWSEEKAELVLRNSLTTRYVASVNRILDANKDLVLTQRQYNALLDVVYHGGPGALKNMLVRVRDVEKGVAFIEKIATKINDTLGEEAASRFGEEFVTSFREAENIYERIALMLQATNLTAGGKITSWYKGMQKIADWRYEMFSGDLGFSSVLGDFMTEIHDLDFTDLVGVKKALTELRPLAEQEGEKAKLALEKSISEVDAEIGLRIKKEADKNLNRQVEDMFQGYELYVELDKMNIPKDFAKAFFGIDALNLDELRERLTGMSEKFIGTDQEDEYVNWLRKLDEMEDKYRKERLKTYLEYARDAVGERAKIKLDEMKKLNEIELAFAVKEGDSDEERDLKNASRAKAIEKVGKDSATAMRKLEWEEFQKSDGFVSLFADLDIASEKLLNHTISKLQDFREEWKDMPLEDVRTIVSKMGELESQLAKSDPFNTGKALRKELRGAPSIHELQEDNWTQEEKIRSIDKELEISEQVFQLRLEGKAVEADTLAYESKREELLWLSAEETKTIVDNQKDSKQTAQDQITANNRLLGKYRASKEALLAQSEAIQSAQKMANDLYDAFKELSEVLGEDDSPAAVFAEMGMSMANSVMNCLALQAQLASATEGAMAFGTAMNMAMGIIGWIVMAVQLIATVLKTAFAMHDNNLEKQIERLQERVEILQKQFEKLSDAIDNAFSNKQLAAYSEDARKNMEAQLHAYEQMIALEDAKKKTDHDKIKEWREDMEELREDFEDMLEDAFSTATSGIVDDVLSATREFVDAWHDAFLETGDGMKGLKDNFRDMLTEILRQQASLQLINPFVNMYKDWLKEYVDIESGDATLSIGEAREWAEKVQATFPEINNLLQNFFAGAEDLLREEGELSELSKGIQGVTETTAQVLEALLNSMRFYVADTNMRVQNIESVLASSDVTRNPILNELQQQTAMVRSIEAMFNSVIGRGSSAHSGAYLKVLM